LFLLSQLPLLQPLDLLLVASRGRGRRGGDRGVCHHIAVRYPTADPAALLLVVLMMLVMKLLLLLLLMLQSLMELLLLLHDLLVKLRLLQRNWRVLLLML
jgi:hypothetical protein